MPRKYGIRDANGKVTYLSEKDYQQKYLQLQEANKIATDKNNVLEGQQHRPHENTGAGIFMEETPDEVKPTEVKTPEVKTTEVPVKNMMTDNFKPKKDIWK